MNASLEYLALTGAAAGNPRAGELRAHKSAVRDYTPRGPQKRVEAGIVADIIKALRTDERVARVERNVSGLLMDGDRFIRVGVKGKLDLSVWLKDGRYCEIEVKRDGKYPEEHQWRRIYAVRAANGLAGCAHSVEEALAILRG